jgi:hypothetical protein
MDPSSMMPPGLAGYLQAQQANQQQGTAQLQQVGVLQQIMAAQEKQQQEQALRQALAQAGGDPEKAMQAALSTGDYKAAHELAPLVKMKQEGETSKLMANAPQMTPDQLDVLAQQLALKNHSGAAQMMSVADKRRKAAAAEMATAQRDALGPRNPARPAGSAAGRGPRYDRAGRGPGQSGPVRAAHEQRYSVHR